MDNNISYIKTRKSISIFFGDHLHLRLLFRDIRGVQSWIEYVPPDKSYPEGIKYCIEYYFSTNSILSEYNKKETWTDILNYFK